MRTFKTIGIVVGIYIAAFVVEIMLAVGNPEYQGGVTILVLLGFLAVMAPKVGYRWFDCFLAAIPLYGIFFIFRIANRVALLPEVDWAERTN